MAKENINEEEIEKFSNFISLQEDINDINGKRYAVVVGDIQMLTNKVNELVRKLNQLQ